jgi:hypothetical protein
MNHEYRIPSFLEKSTTTVSPEFQGDDYLRFLHDTQLDIETKRKQKLDSYFMSSFEARSNAILNPLRRLVGSEVKPKSRELTSEMLIEQESFIGGEMFKESLPNIDCRFFYYEDGSWLFHQTSQIDGSSSTIRYSISDIGVVKIIDVDSVRYQPIDAAELSNFIASVDGYNKLIDYSLYR